ncbi:hypothetical protein [Endozoicomonas numazuensis]|uniref:Fido domain-containing protein n=1 Tax=Endozoicomonas numazuensis TaxID=1137799 RepID=A0A081MZ97_9GAMM|nr:hypothetical protein [Endozoicomonas numazuensis]KEQ11520.1 hypothetical protein GZ78_29015 [Endozoicomonas numazuensis]
MFGSATNKSQALELREEVVTPALLSEDPHSDREETSTGEKIHHRKVERAAVFSGSESRLDTHVSEGLARLRNYPEQELPRLLVDGTLLCREQGVDAYEQREPGCLKTLINGWQFIIQKLKELKPGAVPEVDLQFLLDLHRIVAGHTSNCFKGELYCPMPAANFFIPLTHYDHPDFWYCDKEGILEADELHQKHCDLAGIAKDDMASRVPFYLYIRARSLSFPACLPLEADRVLKLLECHSEPEAFYTTLHEQLSLKNDLKPLVQLFYNCMFKAYKAGNKKVFEGITDKKGQLIVFFKMFYEEARKSFSRVIHRYTVPTTVSEKLVKHTLESLNNSLSKCIDKEELFSIITSHVAELEQLHSFKSVNGRTYTLLMQYLLMAYGFPPATLEMPEMFSMFGKARMIEALKEGLRDSQLLEANAESGLKVQLHGYLYDRNDSNYGGVCREMKNMIDTETAEPKQREQ